MATSPNLPRCTVYIAVSVDGFIARPDGGLDWLKRAELPGEDYGYADFMRTVDVLVMGRKTYEVALGFEPWPYDGKRCVVVSRGAPAPRHGVEVTSEAPRALVDRLGREGVRRVYVDGGTLVRAFFEAGIVDDLVLSVVPVVLGSGIPLWAQGGAEAGLELESSRSWPSGVVQLRYRVERAADPT